MTEFSAIYMKAIKDQYGLPTGWVANWPANHSHRLGDVGSVEELGFNQDGVLANYGLSATPRQDKERTAGPWNLSTSKSIKVDIGTDAQVKGWEWIGKAKAGVKVGFGNEEGMIMSVGSSWYEILQDLDRVRADLLAKGLAKEMPVGRSVIVEQLIADTGLSMVSNGGIGTVEATTTFDAGVGTLPALASFAAGFSVKTQRAGFTHQIFPDGFCVAFRVITLGQRGWFFWRPRPIVVGMTGNNVPAPSFEGFMRPEDYFAAYPDTVFEPFPTAAGPKKGLPMRFEGEAAERVNRAHATDKGDHGAGGEF